MFGVSIQRSINSVFGIPGNVVSIPYWQSVKNLTQELPGARVLGIVEEGFWWAVLYNHTPIREVDVVGDFPGKTHLHAAAARRITHPGSCPPCPPAGLS